MATGDQAGNDCTAILRREPVRIAASRPEGGYTSSFEVICFDCGDDPCRDYPRGAAGASADTRPT